MANDEKARLVQGVIENRILRSSIFPSDLFGEPAWDALLLLFAADAQSEAMTGEQIAKRFDVAPSVLSRWLMVLTERNLILGDGTGNLKDNLTLSPSAISQMEEFLQRTGSAMLNHLGIPDNDLPHQSRDLF